LGKVGVERFVFLCQEILGNFYFCDKKMFCWAISDSMAISSFLHCLTMVVGEKHPEEYVAEFLHAVPEKEIVVGGISLRDIQLQERQIEMERLDTMRKEVVRYRRREEALMVQEEQARVRVLQEVRNGEGTVKER
jgi:uncharacterized protein (UPF0305 family)